MSVKVKSNIFENGVPKNLYFIPKRLIYLKQLLRYGKIDSKRLHERNLRWPYI